MAARRTALFLVSLGALLLVACAGSEDDGTGSGDGGTKCPAGSYDLDGDPKNGCEYKCTPTALSPADPIDPMYVDDNCDGTDGVVANLLFVAPDGTDAPNAGSRTAPMKTLAFAIQAATTQSKDVAVSGDTYSGQITLASGVSLYGQFNEKDADFAFRRGAGVTSTLTTKGTVVVANAIDKETHLEFFEIDAAASDPPMTGLGTYGVRFVGGMGTFYVRWNTIHAEPGQDGPAGQDGAEGANGVGGAKGEDGCNGCESAENPNPPGGGHGGAPPASPCGGAAGGEGGQGGYDQSAGIEGGNGSGANSQGGAGGSGDSKCEVSSGGDGTPGQTPTDVGANGTDGTAASATGMIAADGTYTPSSGGDGTAGAPGNSGGGGGGGGGGTNGGLCKGDRGSGGGSGGTGGCGGGQGTGGSGGGASFGIVARAGTLVVGGNTIDANAGGNGGAGGKGGVGGSGGMGGGGGPRNDDGGASGAGGNGTVGGIGGNGAGGAGGPSACIAVGSSVVLTQTPVNMCTAFGGGKGGVAGTDTTTVGPTGLSMPVLTF